MAGDAPPRNTPGRRPEQEAAAQGAATGGAGCPLRRHYGIAEIADALGLNRQLVTVWRRRRSWNMPEPDDELASGPLWLGGTIEPWIEATRTRLTTEKAASGAAGPAALRQAARRLYRLTALLLADQPRADLVIRAYADLEQTTAALRTAGSGEPGRRLLTTLEPVLAAARPPWPDDAAHTHRRLLGACLTATPGAAAALQDGTVHQNAPVQPPAAGTPAAGRRPAGRPAEKRTG